MCTSPRAKRAFGGSSRKRDCSSSGSSARADSASRPSPCHDGRGFRPASSSCSTRSWRLSSKPDAARAVARDPASPGYQPDVQVGARRRLRTGPSGQLAVGSVRGARSAVSGRLYGFSPCRGEERQPRTGHPALRRLRKGRRGGEAEDDLGAGLPGDPAGARHGRRGHHRPEGGAGVRQVLRAVRPAAAAVDTVHRRRLGLRELLLPDRGGRGGHRCGGGSGSGSLGRGTGNASIGGSCGCPGSAGSPASLRPHRRRGPWRRCSAAGSRW